MIYNFCFNAQLIKSTKFTFRSADEADAWRRWTMEERRSSMVHASTTLARLFLLGSADAGCSGMAAGPPPRPATADLHQKRITEGSSVIKLHLFCANSCKLTY
uniref:Uncharacterized protein n=1 Tax=Triticum urartu TaxID=4572 RepID=A0A8R7PVH0_TRIUA